MAKQKKFTPNQVEQTSGFGQDWGGVSLQTFGVPDDVQTDLMQINEALKLQEYYKSPQYLADQTKAVSGVLEKQIGVTPFTSEMIISPEAKPLLEKDYDEEKQPFVKIFNDIIENGGLTKIKPSKLWGSSFLAGAVNNSMTNGWYKMFTGSDMVDDLGSLEIKQDGFYYDDHKLKLTDFENKLLNDYVVRKTGTDSSDFLDKIGQTFGSLMVDMPLIIASSYVSGGALAGAGAMGRALTTANSFFGRLYGQAIQQAINFNVMGLPQTVKAYSDRGVVGATESIYNSAMMGLLASATGTLGTRFPGGIFKKMMQSSPAMMEEIGGVAGSFGFGYLSGALAGEDWEDNLATGLAFAATHFSNPKAYRRVLAEIKRKDMPVYTEVYDGTQNPFSFHPTYFIKEGEKYFPIDSKEFKTKGDIIKLSTKPIESPDAISNLRRFNEVTDHYAVTYAKALGSARVIKYGKELFDRWTNEISDKKYVQENKDALRVLANVAASQIVLGNVSKKFAVTLLPPDKLVNDQIIQLTEKWGMGYNDIKKFITLNVDDFIRDPEGFKKRLEVFTEEKYGEQSKQIFNDLQNAVAKTADAKNKQFVAEVTKLTGQTKIADVEIPKEEKVKSDKLKPGDTVKFESAGKEQTGKIINFTDEYQNVEIQLEDKRTVNIPINKLTGKETKVKKEKVAEKPVEKVDNNAHIESVTNQLDAAADYLFRDKVTKEEAFNKIDDAMRITKDMVGQDKDSYVVAKQNRIIKALGYKKWEDVPEIVKIYRGESDAESKPIETKRGAIYQNYTLSKDVAKQFAGEEGKIYEYEINKNNIRWITGAYLTKNESEVIAEIKDVSKSVTENVIEPTNKVEKVEELVKPTKQVEPTKPIEAVSQEEVNQAKRDFKTATVGKTLDAKTLQTPAMKEPLDKLIAEAQKQADISNENLLKEHQGDSKWVNSDGTLRKNKAFNAGHKLAYMLIKEEPALTNKQVDAILRNALPELYGDRSPETSIVENMLNTGKLKDVKTYRKAVAIPEETVDVSEIKATPELRMRQSPETAKINEEQRLGNALVSFIDTVKKEGDKTKTVEQLIKEQQELGNLTPEEADYIKAQYGRNVNKKYNELFNIDANKKSSPETAIKLQNDFKEKFKDYDIEFVVDNIKQKFTPEEIKAAGLEGKENLVTRGITTFTFYPTTDEFKNVKMILDRNKANDPAAWEEMGHSLMLVLQGGDAKTYKQFLRKHGWDGKVFDYTSGKLDYSFRAANEDLMRNFRDWNEGFGTALRGFAKLKAFFKTAYRWFTDNGFRAEARFFKALMDGKLEMRRKIHPNVEKNYDPKMGMPIEDVQRLYQIGTEETRSPRDEIKDSDVLRDWNKREPNKWKEDKFFEKFTKSQLADVPTHVKSGMEWMWKNMRPPDFTAKMMPRFAKTYDIGNEHIVLKAPQAFNQTMRENWYIKEDGKSFFNTLPEDVKNDFYGNKVNEYYFKDLANNRYGRMLTKEEFQKAYKLTPDQIKIDNAFQKTVEVAKELARQGQKEIYMDLTENLSAELTQKKFKEFFPEISETEEKPLDKAREILKTDETRKEAIADYLVKKLYDYSVKDENGKYLGQAHYMPFTRSSDPSNWLIDMQNAKGERRSMEAKTKQEAEAKLAEWQSKGYEVTVDVLNKETNETKKVLAKDVTDLEAQGWENIGSNYYRIKDIIGTGQFYNRMTERQLKNMAALGHIPFNNPVIQKLKDSMKAGKFSQHQLERKFVPGVDMTPQRMEESLEEFVKQATGINRLIGNIKLTKELEQWSRESDLLHKSTKTPVPAELRDKYNIKGTMVSEGELNKIKTELGYGTGYVNNITHSDASMIDGYRKLVTAWMLGVRPSYIFQQPFQIFQKLLPYAMTEHKSGNKLFWDALGESVKLKGYIRTNDKGMSQKDIDAFGFDKDMYNIYLALKDMNKMGKVGIEELTSQMGDIKYRYAKGLGKTFETAIKLAAMPAGAAEKFTRIVAMNTFYKIGKANGLSGEKLNKYIANGIDLTMDLWGAPGRAPLLASKEYGKKQNPFMKGLDKSFMTFKTYATHNLAQYEYLMRNRQWNALAVKTAVGLGLHGATKFPLVAGMFAIANLFTDDDTEYDFMAELDKLNGIVPGLGSTLSRGAFANVGFDASGLFDERSLFPTDLIANLRSYSAEGMVAEAMIGAPYGFGQDAITGSKALYDIFANEVLNEPMTNVEKSQVRKNLGKLLPLSLRNIATVGVNWNKDGIMVRNNVIIKKEDLTWKDVLYKLMSFNPIDISKKTEEYIYGFPAKFKRAEGKVSEIRKVYKEIASSKDYTPEERTAEMKNIAKMWKDAQAEVLTMKRTQEYRDAIKTGLIK